MSGWYDAPTQQMLATSHYNAGAAAVYLDAAYKRAEAAEPSLVHALTGRLYKSRSGWVLLSVPNALVRGAFDALNVPGAELPLKDGLLNAHISVMRPEELERIGGADNITERGHEFAYTLGPVKEVEPHGWDEMSKVWFIEVQSPDLRNLRKSYGLAPLPHDGKFQFHITLAVRRKHVLRDNPVSKFDTNQGVESSTSAVKVASKPNLLAELKRAKAESDRGNYGQKHEIIRKLIKSNPGEFVKDEATTAKYVGLKHKTTGFKIHVPQSVVF